VLLAILNFGVAILVIGKVKILEYGTYSRKVLRQLRSIAFFA
jgi:hypothetical protein